MSQVNSKLALFLISMTITITFAACAQSSVPASEPATNNASSSNTDSSTTGSIDYEAVREVEKYLLENYLVKCGDSYYSRSKDEDLMDPLHTVRTYEFKGGGVGTTDIAQLTEADRLNGIQWSGKVSFNYSAQRLFTIAHGWSDWQQNSHTLVWTFQTTKRNGQWNIKPEAGILEHYYKPDCFSVPQ